jgi:putative FmdB family regulatory protein
MPTYEYACKACGQHFDVRQSFSDAPLKVHESCGGELRKVFQPAPIVFKGSGWYVTDSRTKPAGEDGSASPATTGTNKGEPKGETKSEAPKAEKKSEPSAKSDSSPKSSTSEKVA